MRGDGRELEEGGGGQGRELEGEEENEVEGREETGDGLMIGRGSGKSEERKRK